MYPQEQSSQEHASAGNGASQIQKEVEYGMIIVMKPGATEEHIQQVRERLEAVGYRAAISRGVERVVIGAVGTLDEPRKQTLIEQLMVLPFVEQVIRVMKPYKLVSRDWRAEPTLVPVRDFYIGAEEVIIMAGPCAVENREQLLTTAQAVCDYGADVLRGGAYKPRTSPHSFQGLGDAGLELLKEASELTGLPIITEVLDVRDLEKVIEVADIIQTGARNMQNFALLRELGRIDKPVLLKRGIAATIEEWLQAAEYILLGGNQNVILCERGIRTFETYTRNTLDLSAVPAVKELSHLPVIVDPSHATGRWSLVIPMALAAIAAGADGLLVEVHPDPSKALSDGPQALTPNNFALMVSQLAPVASAVGRKLRHAPAPIHLQAHP